MPRLLLGFATLGALSSAVAAQTPGDSTRAVIQGVVRDSLGIPVDGASVLLHPGALIFRTDSAGRFTARRAPVGQVQVALRRVGFAPLDTQVMAPVGGTLTLELRMRRLPQTLREVVVRAEQNRQCPRFSLEGVLCRREVGRGQFMNREEIVATEAIYPMHVLRDRPGFRQSLSGDLRGVESTVGWRCMVTLVDGRPPGLSNPIPRVHEMFAVEVYQPKETPPEYRHWVWRGPAPCTLVVFWSDRAVKQALDRAAGRNTGLTVDVAGGVMGFGGGAYPTHTGLALVTFFGSREPVSDDRVDVLGVSVALLGDPGSREPCHELQGEECRPQTPFLLGLNLERGWRSSRVLGGARYGAGAYFNLNGDGGTALGAHGQVDVSASFVTLALRGVVLPNLHRRPVFLLVLTTGVRWN